MSDEKPAWDEAFARELLGSVVLVGITTRTPDGDTQEQVYGTVVQADAIKIALSLSGSRSGEEYFLPPDPTAFHPAPPGLYRLRASGETVENPDFTSLWTIHPGKD